MSIFEIVAGISMILASVIIIFVVLAQESKGQGLSSVITGTEMMSGESRARTKEARQAKLTKVFAIIFFVLTLLVNFLSAVSPSA